jgi:N-acetylglutamate synthase-like GNAT family acetyltransferase
MDAVAITRFAAADARAVAELVLGIQRGEFAVPITLADQPDLADVPAHYQRARGDFWVARAGDRIVGTIGLLDAGGEVALRKMFVDRAYRGRDHAVGQRLLDALLAHARAQRIPRVLLGTRPEMHAAHRFYEKNGFARIDAAELPPAFPRMAADSVFYRLGL